VDCPGPARLASFERPTDRSRYCELPTPANQRPPHQAGWRAQAPSWDGLFNGHRGGSLRMCRAYLPSPNRDICQGRGGARTGVTSPATAGSVACAVWLRAIRKTPRRGLRVLWRVKKWKADQLALRKRVRFVGQDQDRGRGGAVLSLSPSLTPHGLPRLMCGDYGGSGRDTGWAV
jgi:hypothetical protein